MANRDFNKIKRTIQDFSLNVSENGGETGGGALIVDALPANGKEGQTYLLRQGLITFKLYERVGIDNLTCVVKNNEDASIISDFTQKEFDRFRNAFPMYGHAFSHIDEIYTEEEFEAGVVSGDLVLFESLESLPAFDPEVGEYVHYLGEYTIEDIKMCECRGPEGGFYVQIMFSFIEVEGLINQFSIKDNIYNRRYRDIDPDENNQWIISDWEDISSISIVETLTDEIIIDAEQFDNTFDYSQGAIITFTPNYTYTQYVFDRGKYTGVSASVPEGRTDIVNITNYDNYRLTLDKTSSEIYEMLKNGPVYFSYNNENPMFEEPIRMFPVMITSGGIIKSNGNYEFTLVDLSDTDFIIRYNKENDYWYVEGEH